MIMLQVGKELRKVTLLQSLFIFGSLASLTLLSSDITGLARFLSVVGTWYVVFFGAVYLTRDALASTLTVTGLSIATVLAWLVLRTLGLGG